MLGGRGLKGESTQLNINIPFELAERFKDGAHWLELTLDQAGEEAVLGWVHAKERELGSVFIPRPDSARGSGRRPRKSRG